MGSINTIFHRIHRFVNGATGNNVRFVPNTPTTNTETLTLNPRAVPTIVSLFEVPSVSEMPGFCSEEDRRFLLKACKFMDQVVKSCHSPRLNLKNSPPFILDILPDTYTHLMLIFTQNNDILQDNEYLKIFLESLINKCKEIIKLFKTSSIYNDQSEERRKLTMMSLTFSHMLFEIKAMFPEGLYIEDRFRMTKKEADSFWTHHFLKKNMVPWPTFLAALEKYHGAPIGNMESAALKATIDLSGDDYISNFEFDVFTRLFYPFKTLIKNWQTLTTAHPGYCAFLTYDEVKKRLEKLTKKPGSYIFRLSCTRPGQWAIGYVAPDGKIYQTIPQNKSLIQALHEGHKEGFYIYPNGRDQDINLSKLMDVPQADRVQVTSEQYELYCEMGTTFELCKICDDNEKNIKIEPCGHLLCAKCLANWQDSDGGGNTCPFCRYEIKGTNRVIIDRFKPAPGEIEKASEKKLITIAPDIPPRTSSQTSTSYVNVNDLENMPTNAESSNLNRHRAPSVQAPPLPPRLSVTEHPTHPHEYTNTSNLIDH
ncbi:CRE-SLI-1 protein [Caenorhabditis remanei]|uniref:E3 ubiquitin-protein ligase CBL n=1 Tax=Caenorhabditis remanei TaxID=31234 RepID=E3MA78_CAERE|nr:CRE-SLI-1 protein [Caenorhabditis remanei]